VLDEDAPAALDDVLDDDDDDPHPPTNAAIMATATTPTPMRVRSSLNMRSTLLSRPAR
jgi:hypothetical protein